MPQTQAPHEVNLEAGEDRGIGDTGAQPRITDDPRYPPQPAQNGGENEGESNFVDGSDHFFTMYTEMAGEEDNKMVERWQADAEGILVFVSPDSAAHIVPTRLTDHRLVYFLLLSRH
jgi:hypothetical protein